MTLIVYRKLTIKWFDVKEKINRLLKKTIQGVALIPRDFGSPVAGRAALLRRDYKEAPYRKPIWRSIKDLQGGRQAHLGELLS